MSSDAARPAEQTTATPFQAEEEESRRSRLLQTVAFAAVIGSVVLGLAYYLQPETRARRLWTLVVAGVIAVVIFAFNRKGRTRLASWIFIGGLLALQTLNALRQGGVRSPSIHASFISVTLAGLLLGERAGFAAAGLCALLGLGLVVLEWQGMLPPVDVPLAAPVQWLLSCMYIGLAALAMALSARTQRAAMTRLQSDLEKRRRTEQRLSNALDAGEIGVFEYYPDAGLFHVDHRVAMLTGVPAAQDGTIPYDVWEHLVHPADRQRFERSLDDRAANDHSWTAYRIIRPDGALRHVEVASYPAGAAGGRPASTVGMILDVTERTESVRERDRLVHDLGERVKELKLLHYTAQLLQKPEELDRDLLGTLVAAMPQAWRHADDCAARIVYLDIEVTSPGWTPTAWTQTAFFETSAGRGLVEVAYRHLHPAADEGPFFAEERALLDSIAEMLRAHIEQFVTEQQRRALERGLRQTQKMEALGTLAGGIAHDFNNILTAIGGNAELAAIDLPPGSQARESLAEILRAHDRARDLVKQILQFSRPQEVERTVIGVAPAVNDALKLLRVSLPPGVRVESTVDPDVPDVAANATQLHQVVLNLGTNAGHAMNESGGVLSVVIDTVTIGDVATAPSPDLQAGPHARITMRDTGCGMSREVLDRLFEPFFTTKGHAGTGLGLAVVHGIVRDHGGAITVESAVGEGSTFRVYLPAVTAAASSARDHAADVVGRGSGQHVMYVDDEPALALLMSRTLERLGYRCTPFTDAHAALHELRASPHAFDAVVTDMHMPSMSGIDLARAVRAIRPDMPVAIATGLLPVKARADEAAVSAWLRKPSSQAELGRAVRALFEN